MPTPAGRGFSPTGEQPLVVLDSETVDVLREHVDRCRGHVVALGIDYPADAYVFRELIDMPERTWRRWQAKARAGGQPKGPWPQPVRQSAREATLKHALGIRRGVIARSGRSSAMTAT